MLQEEWIQLTPPGLTLEGMVTLMLTSLLVVWTVVVVHRVRVSPHRVLNLRSALGEGPMFIVWLLVMWVLLPSFMLKLDGLPLAVSVLCLVVVRVRQLALNLRLGEGTTTTTCALATGVLRALLVLSSPLRMLEEVQLVALQLTLVVVSLRARDQQWVWETSMILIIMMVVPWSVMTLSPKAVTRAAVVIKVSERWWTRMLVGAWVMTWVWALVGRPV